MTWLEALVLGVVQGVTEFLPVSSDGHLAVLQILAARLQGRAVEGKMNLFFDVMLHVGTVIAILIYYQRVELKGMRGLLGATDVPEAFKRSSVVRVGLLAAVATLPLIPYALVLKDLVEGAFESLTAAGVGFLVTAAALLVSLRLPGGEKGPATTTWGDALLIGLAQMAAPLPGVSRSGLTIATALALGLNRAWAVQFSLLMAVPAICGAAVFEARKVRPALLTVDFLTMTAVAAAVAGVVGYLAIGGLVRVVRTGRLWYFSVYLIVLGVAILVGESGRWGRDDGREPPALDGPVRGGPGRPGAGPAAGRALGTLDRPDPGGPGPGRASPGHPLRPGHAAPRLDLG